MKKFLCSLLVCVLAFSAFLFVGCTNSEKNPIKLEGGPSLEQNVLGNGSFAVRKGDYLYFASGYVNTSDLGATLTNNLGDVKNGAIYRAKVETKTTEVPGKEGEEPTTKTEIVLSNAEMLVSKVAGFDKSGLYIFGNKLYFATPSNVKNSEGNVMYSLLSFYSLDLNGENLNLLYETSEYTNGSYSFVTLENSVYLLVYNGTSIVAVKENGEEKVVVSEAKSAVLPKTENVLNNTFSATENQKYVYYTVDNTKNTESRNYGNVLKKTNILNGQTTTIFEQDYVTVTLSKLENDKLFYSRNKVTSGTAVTSDAYLFVNDLNGNETQYSNQANVKNVFAFTSADASKTGYVYINNSKLVYRNSENETKILTESATTVIGTSGNYVYYVSSSALYRVDATAENPTTQKLSDTHTINTTYFDVDSNVALFYVKNKTTSVYETYYIDLTNFVSGTTKPVKAA